MEDLSWSPLSYQKQLQQHSPMELSAIMGMFYISAVSHSNGNIIKVEE